jgi:hypothetical protein
MPQINEFLKVASSPADGTRPANAWGTSVVPGNNTYGSYANLGVISASDPAYGILININSNGNSTLLRDLIVTIGIDPAGGTSFTDYIPHLLGSCAQVYEGIGVEYYFPLRVPAGASVGAKASVNNVTVATCRVAATLYCQPSRPDLVRAGSFVRTFGDVAASSTGTAVTPGTTSEGAWTQLGSALAESLWYWECGFGINNGTMTSNGYHLDVGLGDASNKRVAVYNTRIFTTGAETLSKVGYGAYARGAVGDLVYGRMQVGPNAADAGISMIAYGVGG